MSYDAPPHSLDTRHRRLTAREEYEQVEEDYRARRESSRVGFEDRAFGRTIFDVDNPMDSDPEYRAQVYSEMGAALRAQIQEQRHLPASERIFTERSSRSADGQSPQSRGPATIREARKLMNQRTREPEYDDEEPYDDDDYYPEDRRPVSRRSRDRSDRDPYAALEPQGAPLPPQRRSLDARRAPPARREVSSPPSRQAAYSAYERSPQSNRPVQRARPEPPRERRLPAYGEAPVRPTDRRSRQEDQRDPREYRQTAAPPQAPKLARNTPSSEQRSGVEPTRPDLLGPDGAIPRNPCGQPMFTILGATTIIVECTEERRSTGVPFHANMPHIARINDPRSNAVGYFIWYYPGEEPGR